MKQPLYISSDISTSSQVSIFTAVNAQKTKFSIKGFCSKCDQIRRRLRIWSHLLKKPLMKNYFLCLAKQSTTESSTFITLVITGGFELRSQLRLNKNKVTAQKLKFSIKERNPEEILNGKLHFQYSEYQNLENLIVSSRLYLHLIYQFRERLKLSQERQNEEKGHQNVNFEMLYTKDINVIEIYVSQRNLKRKCSQCQSN